MCHNSITGGHMNFILGSQHEDDPPTSKAQNGCHSNDGCLTTGPLILQLMIEYIKNFKFSNRRVHSTRTLGHVTKFFEKWVKGQGHNST